VPVGTGESAQRACPDGEPRQGSGLLAEPGNVSGMSDRSRKMAKPMAGLGVLATMASIWWFALRPRRKAKRDTQQ
jgi:hypothetical protein